jgi:hypothetical protein
LFAKNRVNECYGDFAPTKNAPPSVRGFETGKRR